MQKTDQYYYGQGRVSIAIRDAVTNVPGPFQFIGDVSALSVKLTVDKVTHNESVSGQMAQTVSFPTKKTATVDLTVNQIDSDNLAIALFGTKVTTAEGTVTGEAVAGLTNVGDEFYLANQAVSDLVLTDSAATPKTLTEGTDYSLDDANFGRGTLLNTTGITLPIKAAYSYGGSEAVGMFTAKQPNVALRYEGVNLADNNKPVLVDLYKVTTDPLAELALISTGNDVAGMQITGGVLLDTTKSASGALGQFGVIKKITPVAA